MIHSRKELYNSKNFCDIKNIAIWLAESNLVYNFFQNMRFLQNHKDNYGA